MCRQKSFSSLLSNMWRNEEILRKCNILNNPMENLLLFSSYYIYMKYKYNIYYSLINWLFEFIVKKLEGENVNIFLIILLILILSKQSINFIFLLIIINIFIKFIILYILFLLF
jgi:hypothetical protein